MSDNKLAELVGCTVVSVDTKDSERVKLMLSDGREATFGLDADCCSHSYFTDLGQFHELAGGLILNAEERHGVGSGDSRDVGDDNNCISWHFLVFMTSHGHVTIDWRNDSNGYYDGSLLMDVR